MTDEQLIESLRARTWAGDCEAAAFRIEQLLARVAELESAQRAGATSVQSPANPCRDHARQQDADEATKALRYIAWEASGYMECVSAAKRAIGETGALPPPPCIVSKVRPEFDHIYADTPGLFSLVSEDEFRQSMGVGLRDCHSSRMKTHEPDPCSYRMRITDPGCTWCADRDEDQAAEAGGGK